MLKIYNEVNAMQSEVGEMLNTYFIDPVSRTVSRPAQMRKTELMTQDYPDYFQIIKRPICMKQIKKKIDKDATYSLPTFKSEMHLLWDNARTYNQEGSWVYEAADQMQEEFDRLYDIELASIASRNANTSGGSGSGGPSQVASGTSTPMFKAAGVGKIKLNLGSKLKAQAAQSVASGTGSLTGEDSGDDDDEDEDDDY
jgi:ATP-dependent helicase STH1/SNF2